MIPFFIFLGIIIFNIFTFILLYLSILEIEVEELKVDTENKVNDFLIYVRLKFLKKITWAKIKIDNEQIRRYKSVNNKILNKITINLKNQTINKKSLTRIKDFKIRIKKVNVNIKIGLLNPITTAFVTTFVSTILSNIFAKKIEEYSKEKCNYKIEPIYSTKPQLKLDLNCIIYVKMVHIISIIYMLNGKRSEKNGKFSSNRRAYESLNV